MKFVKRLLAMMLTVILAVGGMPTVFAAEHETTYTNGQEEEQFFVSAEELSIDALVLEVGESVDLTVLLGEEIMLVEISSDEDFVLISPNVLTEDGIAIIEGLSISESDVTITFWATTTPSALTMTIPDYSNETTEDEPNPEEATKPIIKTIRVYVIEPMAFMPLSFNAPTFFDDFTVDTLFWDSPRFTMRRYNNMLVTNISNWWSHAQTRGRAWDNFIAEVDFKFTSPVGVDFIVFHIRHTDLDNNIAIVIHEYQVQVIRNWDLTVPSQWLGHHSFPRGEMHSVRIVAQDEFIDLFRWCNIANDFVQINNEPIIHGIAGQPPQSGQILIRAWQESVAIDRVKIIDTNPTEFFFANSFVRAEVGTNPQIMPVNDTPYSIDSISFVSDKPNIISVDNSGILTAHRQYLDYVKITATAILSNGQTITIYYHAVTYAPFDGQASFILHPNHPNHNQILRVGDTMNLNLFTNPMYVSDVRFDWITSHPNAMQFVGNNQIQRGIRAIAPANN
ncbi:MAG: hypothetical protein FWC89_07490, partial [Defluviitaleaceae bacterium]|nr:hypothetical protein [Defluviitaleaceae bacterium]